MRNFVVGCIVLFAMVGSAFSETKEPPKKAAVDLGGGVKMELVLIPAGEFKMGSGESAEETAAFFKKNYGMDFLTADSFKDEHPQHRVRITVLHRSIFDAVRDFLHDEAFEGHDKIMTRYLKPDLLILDDMGLKQLPKRSGEYLFEIIMRRHQLHSTMMTSNRPLEDWGKLMNDVPAATAILDRLLSNAEILQITGKSYRLRGGGDSSKDSG